MYRGEYHISISYSLLAQLLNIVHRIRAAQLAVLAIPHVRDIAHILRQTLEVLQITVRRQLQCPIERRHAMAQLHRLPDAALLHAAGERVLVIVVDAQAHLVRKDALALHDAQLAGIFRRVRLLHRDEQLRGVRRHPFDLRPKVPAEVLGVRQHENSRSEARYKVQGPFFVRLEEIVEGGVVLSGIEKCLLHENV